MAVHTVSTVAEWVALKDTSFASGDTIELLNDIDFQGQSVEPTLIGVPYSGSLIIDFKGYACKNIVVDYTGDYYFLKIAGSSITVTIKDINLINIQIYATGKIYGIYNPGTLNIEKGSISIVGTTPSYFYLIGSDGQDTYKNLNIYLNINATSIYITYRVFGGSERFTLNNIHVFGEFHINTISDLSFDGGLNIYNSGIKAKVYVADTVKSTFISVFGYAKYTNSYIDFYELHIPSDLTVTATTKLNTDRVLCRIKAIGGKLTVGDLWGTKSNSNSVFIFTNSDSSEVVVTKPVSNYFLNSYIFTIDDPLIHTLSFYRDQLGWDIYEG